jgi:hypothetical protein
MILARRCTSRVVAFTGLILFAVLAVVPTQASVAITEFMAATEFSLPDEDGEPSDWIEITNSGADDLSLVASVTIAEERRPAFYHGSARCAGRTPR